MKKHTPQILVVEDCGVMFLAMEQQLTNQAKLHGLTLGIRHATTLTEAKKKLKESSPEIISTDISFPESDTTTANNNSGIQLVEFCFQRRLRSPIIIYTGEDETRVRRKLLEIKLLRKTYPSILEKEILTQHAIWAQTVIGTLRH